MMYETSAFAVSSATMESQREPEQYKTPSLIFGIKAWLKGSDIGT